MSSAQKCTLDLSQARPACLPRLSQESVLAFHSLSPLSRSHAFCFGFGPGLLLCLQGEAAGHLLLHIKTSPPSIWPGRGDPGETSLPWQRVSSQAHRPASSAACAVGQSQSQPAGMEGEVKVTLTGVCNQCRRRVPTITGIPVPEAQCVPCCAHSWQLHPCISFATEPFWSSLLYQGRCYLASDVGHSGWLQQRSEIWEPRVLCLTTR